VHDADVLRTGRQHEPATTAATGVAVVTGLVMVTRLVMVTLVPHVVAGVAAAAMRDAGDARNRGRGSQPEREGLRRGRRQDDGERQRHGNQAGQGAASSRSGRRAHD
jgi:hypothetical protein